MWTGDADEEGDSPRGVSESVLKSNPHSTLADGGILRKIDLSVLSDPRLDRNELRDVTRDAALQDRAVPPDHVLRENFRLIRLRDDCTENRQLALGIGYFHVSVILSSLGLRFRTGKRKATRLDLATDTRARFPSGRRLVIEFVYFLRRAIESRRESRSGWFINPGRVAAAVQLPPDWTAPETNRYHVPL